MKYNYNTISKLLEKIFKAGFVEEKSILAMQLEDLIKIPDINSQEILLLIELKKAIRNRKLIAFLSGYEEKKEGKIINEKLWF